ERLDRRVGLGAESGGVRHVLGDGALTVCDRFPDGGDQPVGRDEVKQPERDHQPKDLGGERVDLVERRKAAGLMGCCFVFQRRELRWLTSGVPDDQLVLVQPGGAKIRMSAMTRPKMPSASVTAKPKIRLPNCCWAADGLRIAACR